MASAAHLPSFVESFHQSLVEVGDFPCARDAVWFLADAQQTWLLQKLARTCVSYLLSNRGVNILVICNFRSERAELIASANERLRAIGLIGRLWRCNSCEFFIRIPCTTGLTDGAVVSKLHVLTMEEARSMQGLYVDIMFFHNAPAMTAEFEYQTLVRLVDTMQPSQVDISLRDTAQR